MKQLTVNDHEAIKHIISTIELLRADKGLSISALSIEAELSENTLKYILRKESYPTIPVLIRLCDVFDLTLWQFFQIVDGCSRHDAHKTKEMIDCFETLNLKHKDLLIYIAKAIKE